MAAQRFPKDFDGIVAGAPANFWTNLDDQRRVDTMRALNKPGAWLSPDELALVSEAALSAPARAPTVIWTIRARAARSVHARLQVRAE